MSYLGNNTDHNAEVFKTTKDRFSGNGSATAFTLSAVPANAESMQVFVNNVRQDSGRAYTVSGTTLTFTEAPSSASGNIYVVFNSVIAGISQVITANTQLRTGVVTQHAMSNTAFYSMGELLVGGTIKLDNTGDIYLDSDSSVIHFGDDGDVTLTHNHNAGVKLAGAGGSTTSFNLSNAVDTGGTTLGHSSSSDLGFIQVVESGADFEIKTGGTATGNKRFTSTGDVGTTELVYGTDKGVVFNHDGAVDLYHNNAKKFETSASGVTVTSHLAFSGSNPGILGSDTDGRLGLHSDASASAGSEILLYGSAHGSVPHVIRFRNNNSDSVTINATGKVGIGVTAPDAKLDVYQAAVGGTGYQNGIRVHAVSGIDSRWFEGGGSDMGIGTHSNHSFALRTNNNAKLIVAAGGDVGIGAASSYAKLQITGGAGSLPSETASGETILQVQNNAGATDTARMSIISGTSGQSNLDFGDSGDENMGSVYYSNATNLMGLRTSGSGVDLIIDSNGKVGIGSTSPAALLHVEGTGKFVTGTDTNGFIISENANNDQAIMMGVSGGSGSGSAYIKAVSGSANESLDLVFQTASSGTIGTAFTLRANNSAEFNSHFSAPAAGSQFLVGHSSYINTGTSAYSQIHYANKGNTLLLGEWSSTNASYPALRMLKSASSTIGTNAIVADGEHLGAVEFNAADGVDYISVAAAIRAYVNGTPGDSDMPGALTFDTASDGAYNTSERVRITSAGKVGIATTAPTGYLEIGPTGTNTESIILKRTQAGHNNIIKLMTSSTDDWIIGQRNSGSTSDFRFYSYGASNDVLTILRANGYVGIGAGVTAPEARLEVLGNSDSVAGIKIGANATHGWHFYDSSTNGDLHIKSEASGTQTEVIRFTRANQYVGIGTSSPHRRLHIAGGTATGLQITGNSTGAGSGDGMMISIRNDNNGVEFIQQENSHISFQTNGANDRLHITAAGNVGIGTTSPANLLDVAPDTDVNARIGRTGIGYGTYSDYAWFSHVDRMSAGNYALIQDTNGWTAINSASGQAIAFRENNVNKMYLTGGKLGIATTAPSTSLHVKNGFMRVQAGNQGSGDFTQAVGIDWSQESDSQVGKIQMVRTAWSNAPHKMEFYVRNTSSTILKTLTLENDGDGTLTGTLTESASDIRLKENINPITDALSKVKTMNGFTYTWNDVAEAECDFLDKEEVHVGLSAQDVEKVLPEVIKPAPANEKYKTIKYDRLIPLLVESIKELSAKVEYIDELEARIKTLEG